jgi:hypothetical protein
VPIEGPLRERSIHDVFQLLDLARKSGVLRITSDLRQNAGEVAFDHGAVTGARVESNPHPLGSVLLRAGKITEADLAHASELQANGDKRRLGDLLVELGAISRRALERQARAQIEEVVFSLMGWTEGYFSFEEGEAPPWSTSVRISTEALLMEAARRIDEWSRIEARIPHLGVVPRLVAQDAGGTLDLIPLEWEVLAAIDGERDLRLVSELLGRSEFEVGRAAFGLAGAGVIVLDDPLATAFRPNRVPDVGEQLAEAEDHLAIGDPESARRIAEELAVTHPELAAAHVMLGRALYAERRYQPAEAAFSTALRADPFDPTARRLLALTQVALGRLDLAIENWDRWLRLEHPPEVDTSAIAQLREAAVILLDAMRGRHD